MPFKQLSRLLALMLAVAMLSFMLACGGDDDDEVAEDDGTTETAAAGTPYKSSGNEGSITGAVSFTGEAPAPKTISMDADAACAQSNPNPQTEDVLVKTENSRTVLSSQGRQNTEGKSITSFAFGFRTQWRATIRLPLHSARARHHGGTKVEGDK